MAVLERRTSPVIIATREAPSHRALDTRQPDTRNFPSKNAPRGVLFIGPGLFQGFTSLNRLEREETKGPEHQGELVTGE